MGVVIDICATTKKGRNLFYVTAVLYAVQRAVQYTTVRV
jgi:hypothetical protein